VHFAAAGHFALAGVKLRKAPVQCPDPGLEFVASAHGGVSGITIYSSLYSIFDVHKADLFGSPDEGRGISFLANISG
jgi:hypothetical protein